MRLERVGLNVSYVVFQPNVLCYVNDYFDIIIISKINSVDDTMV